MRPVRRRAAWSVGAVTGLVGLVWLSTRPPQPAPSPRQVTSSPRAADAAATKADGEGEDHADRSAAFRVPTGAPAALSCEDAQRVIEQLHEELAYEPRPIRPSELADGAVDWLDPHGMWSASAGSPVALAIKKHAAGLLREVDASSGSCPAAHAVGEVLVRWIATLRESFDRERAAARARDRTAETPLLFEPIGDGATSGTAPVDFAGMLGAHVGAGDVALGSAGDVYTRAASDRFLPTLDAEGWSRAVLASVVRAYVPLVDPHGAWAPLEEESSVYEVDLDAKPPVPLWDKVSRTALGARIDAGALAPLRDGDVVVALAGVPTAGLPMEQIDELAVAVGDARARGEAVVLRPGEAAPRALTLMSEADAAATPDEPDDDLPVARVPFDDGDVAVINVPEVKDDLGDQMARAVRREKVRAGRRLAGVLLDLRGNGGGSTDGASATIGLFLPGATLFPMRRRDGSLETDRAPEPPVSDRWTGPVATLVDGNTASAAEMIAGALAAYRRGPVVGRPTYGKGCAQEYQDDDAHAGVLRVTTLLYALPDGTPVQRVGLTPNLRIAVYPLPGEDTSNETEAKVEGTPPTWRGPDVRDPQFISKGPMVWPEAKLVGPCDDADVCRAIRALAAGKTPRVVAAVK